MGLLLAYHALLFTALITCLYGLIYCIIASELEMLIAISIMVTPFVILLVEEIDTSLKDKGGR